MPMCMVSGALAFFILNHSCKPDLKNLQPAAVQLFFFRTLVTLNTIHGILQAKHYAIFVLTVQVEVKIALGIPELEISNGFLLKQCASVNQ